MLQVGITGGIGSGKTTVCRVFESLHIPVYYADREAKKLYDSDLLLKARLKQVFGEELYPEGRFNPTVLREKVFRDEEQLALLNSLVHPVVLDHSRAWMKSRRGPYALKEAALLVESGSYKTLDQLIVVSSPMHLRMQRIAERDGLAPEEIADRMRRQLPEEELMQHADFVIYNNEDHLLIPQVWDIHQALLAKAVS